MLNFVCVLINQYSVKNRVYNYSAMQVYIYVHVHAVQIVPNCSKLLSACTQGFIMKNVMTVIMTLY